MNISIDTQALREMEAKELRLSAIHEAAHAAIIRRFGGVASPTVWRNDSGALNESAWLGTCLMYAAPGKKRTWPRGWKKKFGILKPPKRWAVYVGLAGFVAEQMEQGEHDEWFIHDHLRFADDEVSKSDFDLMSSMGRFPGHHEVAITVRHLTAVWHLVTAEATSLMEMAPWEKDPRS